VSIDASITRLGRHGNIAESECSQQSGGKVFKLMTSYSIESISQLLSQHALMIVDERQ
jgi:hypothetical protein